MQKLPQYRSILGILFLCTLLSSSVLKAAEPRPTKVFESGGNPILGDGSYFSADAAPLSADGKLYIYAGHDEAAPEVGGFVMHNYGVFVTADPKLGDWALYQSNLDPAKVFDWATGNNAYAGQVARGHDGKYYWYVPVEWKNTEVTNRMAIGVAVADGPLGPWKDPIGKPLLSWADVFGTSKHGQEVIDPHVFTDDDGAVYLYWGSWGVARVVELDESMTAVKGEIHTLRGLESHFEAPWVFKRNDTYYLVYDWKQGGSKWTPSNYQAAIGYATSSSPTGPWKFQGIILSGTSATTVHPSIVEHGDRWWITYHTRDAESGGHFRRSVAIDEVQWEGDRILPVEQTWADPPALRVANNIAPDAKVSASFTEQPPMTLGALNDGRPPALRLPPDQWGNFRGKESTIESDWVQYNWEAPVQIGGIGIQFHQDPNWIRPPASWKLEYQDAQGEWQKIKDASYPTKPDQWHESDFQPLTTTAIRATFYGQQAGEFFHSVSVSEREVYAANARQGQNHNGDQFLDGIGETALAARYLFDGDLEDWSRNGLNASAVGEDFEFVEDETFGQVLSLSGGTDGTYLRVPVSAIGDAVSFSVSGWVKVNEETPGQYFFDLGTAGKSHLGLIPMGAEREGGCGIWLASGDGKNQRGPSSFRVRPHNWAHLVAVLDASRKTVSLYVDGKRVDRVQGLEITGASLLDKDNPDKTRFYLGRSIATGGPRLSGQLHDVRLYRSALSDQQVAVIRHNAVSDQKITANGSGKEGHWEDEREIRPHPLHAGLLGVSDIEVTTEVGTLPHLPYEVPGIYKDGIEGPAVRVIWPSPVDNSAVANVGSYAVTGKVPGTSFELTAKVQVIEPSGQPSSPAYALTPFPLSQVVLNPDQQGNPTLFMEHRDKFFSGLANTDPDRFLYVFRDAFGQEQPENVRPLGGWDSQQTRLRGHATGHYLTALAQAYASTSYDPQLQAQFEQKMQHMIDVLDQLSQLSGSPASLGGPSHADPTTVPPGPGKSGFDSNLSREGIRTDYWNWGKGFISGYPPDQFIMLEQGASYGGGNDQVWAPYYTLHKILAGLVDCYELGGNRKALDIARNMGLWVHARLHALPKKTRMSMWNTYIAGEYGGMNEVMARLYRITGDERFLETAKLFNNTKFFFGDDQHRHGIARNVDTIRGRHANQHIPQILGALETYRCTHELPYYRIAENFWDICQHSYMYSIGGVAGARSPNNSECFTAEPDTLFHNGLAEGGQNETCATYNLLKLARELFMVRGDANYIDYYERAMYNHILASVDDDNPGNTYHVPLNPGARKSFGNARMDGFTCCNGTAIESGTKLQDSIYFKHVEGNAVYVNLFVPSTLDWQERDVKLSQATSFPFANTVRLTLTGAGEFSIFVRVPKWTDEEFSVWINEEEQKLAATPGTYLELNRTWKNGDRIDLRIPLNFHFLPLMDQPNISSIFYGPVLLAAEESGARSSFRTLVLDMDQTEYSISGDPANLHFRVGEASLKPFFEFYDGFHSAYFNIEAAP